MCSTFDAPNLGERRPLIARSEPHGPCDRTHDSRHVRPITGIIGRVGRLRGGYALPTLGRGGNLSWCSNGLTGAEVRVRLAMGVRGKFLETDPRGELLDRADLAGYLDIMGAAGASVQMEYIAARP